MKISLKAAFFQQSKHFICDKQFFNGKQVYYEFTFFFQYAVSAVLDITCNVEVQISYLSAIRLHSVFGAFAYFLRKYVPEIFVVLHCVRFRSVIVVFPLILVDFVLLSK